MAKFDDSQYHQLKKDLSAKKKFKFHNFIFDIMLASVIAFVILNFTTTGSEVFVSDWFGLDPSKLNWHSIITGEKLQEYVQDKEDHLDYFAYYFYVVPVLVFFGFLLGGKSYAQTLKEYRYKKGKKNFLTKTALKIKKAIDKPIKAAGNYFLNDLFMPLSSVDSKVADRLGMRWGWLSHIEHSFFKRVVEKFDAYQRVEELNLLADYERLLAKKGDVSNESYEYILSFFGEDGDEMIENFEDIMKITEGYLSKSGEKKYDKVLSWKEAKKMLKNGDIYTFKAYNKKDTVYFSFDIICKLLDSETDAYKRFIKEMWYDRLNFSSGAIITRKLNKLFKDFINQNEEYIADVLYPLEYKANAIQEIKKLKESDKGIKMLAKRVYEVLPYFFRFVLMRKILNQYTHIPSGTYVSRMVSYDAKMVIETVDSKKVIEIVKNVNDGRSKTFRSDIFVNMFLVSFYYFGDNYGYGTTLDERLNSIFNFSVKNIQESVISNPFGDNYIANISGMDTSKESVYDDYVSGLMESAKRKLTEEEYEKAMRYFNERNNG